MCIERIEYAMEQTARSDQKLYPGFALMSGTRYLHQRRSRRRGDGLEPLYAVPLFWPGTASPPQGQQDLLIRAADMLAERRDEIVGWLAT